MPDRWWASFEEPLKALMQRPDAPGFSRYIEDGSRVVEILDVDESFDKGWGGTDVTAGTPASVDVYVSFLDQDGVNGHWAFTGTLVELIRELTK